MRKVMRKIALMRKIASMRKTMRKTMCKMISIQIQIISFTNQS